MTGNLLDIVLIVSLILIGASLGVNSKNGFHSENNLGTQDWPFLLRYNAPSCFKLVKPPPKRLYILYIHPAVVLPLYA